MPSVSTMPLDLDALDRAEVDGLESLARGQGVSLWRQIESLLERAIARDGFAPSGQLPPEAELAKRFGVNRHTVRQAVKALSNRGVLRIEQGRGTFVDNSFLEYAIGSRTRFSANLAERERLPSHTLLALTDVELDGSIAAALGVIAGTPGICHRTLSFADGVPVAFGATYLELERFGDARTSLSANPSVTALFASVGEADYRRGWTRIATRMPTPEEAQHLRQSRDRPVLLTEALDVTATGSPLGFNHTIWAGQRVALTVGN